MNDEIPDAVIYIYGILNMVIMAARVVSIGAAIWVAFKPDGSVLAGLIILGKRIKWLILPLHESETDRHLIGLSG